MKGMVSAAAVFAVSFAMALGLMLWPAVPAEASLDATDFEMLLLAESLELSKAGDSKIVSSVVVATESAFQTRVVTLQHGSVGPIRMKIRAPKAPGRYPVLVIASGAKAGMDSMDAARSDLPVTLVAFDYPLDGKAEGAKLALEVLKNVASLQTQFAVALNWLVRQPFVRADRINLLYVSFGTFVSPFPQRLAQFGGFEAYTTVFAYGGADLRQMILPELGPIAKVSEAQTALNAILKVADLIDPKNHLPELKSRFFVLQGAKDEIIPAAATKALYDRLPEPKKLVVVDTPHINLDRPDVLAVAGQAIFAWLLEQDAFALK